jgi:cytochrome c oxidase assembly protein subunit 15
MERQHIGFRRFAIITVVSVYLLILAGGIVRTTGSGMGCPDWPKCFGKWIPPTSVTELPLNYHEIYSVHGYEAEFNPVKTWIEYINRLLGALIGVFIFIAFVLSLRYKSDKKVSLLCGTALVLVVLEGVVGKFVVSTNLKPLLISFHLWGSIFIILLLIYVTTRVNRGYFKSAIVLEGEQLRKITLLLIGLTVIQILLGTQVRQQVDALSANLGFERRAEWVQNLNYYFVIHRTFSLVVLAANLYFILRLYKSGYAFLKICSIIVLMLVAIEMLSGFIIGNFNIPAVMQPVHMLVATLLLGVQFFVLFVLDIIKKEKTLQIV